MSISALTVAGLQRARKRGVKLGCPNPRAGQAAATRVHREGAIRFAEQMLPHVRAIQATGITSLRGIAEALEARGLRSRRGLRFSKETVSNLLCRYGDRLS